MNNTVIMILQILLVIFIISFLIELNVIAVCYLYKKYIKVEPVIDVKDVRPLEVTNSTKAIWDLINQMISHETTMVMQKIIPLGRKYDITRADKDIQYIANRVFEGIDKSVLTDPSFQQRLFVTQDWLIQYIVTVTSRYFINQVMEYNQSV